MAWGLKDLLDVLDRWGEWKAMRAAPNRVDELEKRVAALEQKLGDTWPPDVCRFCGKRAARLYHSLPNMEKGTMREEWRCSECGQTDVKVVKASSR